MTRVDTIQSSKKKFQTAGEKCSSSYTCGSCGYVQGTKCCPASGKLTFAKGFGHFASVCETKSSSNSARRIHGVSMREDCAYTAGVTFDPNEEEKTPSVSSDSTRSFQIGALDRATVEKTW